MLMGGREALVSGVDDDRRSALHYACGTGVVKVVQLLLANGAEVDLRDKEGYTPLHLASGYMHVPVIRALIDAGADPEVEDKDGRSPLALVESLRDNLPDNNPTVFSRKLQLEEVSIIFFLFRTNVASLLLTDGRPSSPKKNIAGDQGARGEPVRGGGARECPRGAIFQKEFGRRGGGQGGE